MIDDSSQNSQNETQTQTQETEESANSQSQNEDQKTAWGRIIPRRITVNRLGYGNGRLHEILSASFDLCEETFSIGRGPEADWRISSQYTSLSILDRISKTHCRITKDCTNVENPIFIEDLSRNGTFLNEKLIGFKQKRILKTDDVISLNDPKYKLFQFINCYQEGYGLPDKIFDKYYIGKQLGSGAQGTVRLVIDRTTCKKFAMKIVKRTGYDPNNRLLTVSDERIMREAQIMSKLEHPNIIQCNNFMIIGDSIYMFLDYMKGGDLLHLIQRKKFLPPETTKSFFYQLCAAVKYVHDEGYIHRDIKPENILLTSNDELTQLKLSDFGLSKLLLKDNPAELHTLCGTPLYVSPEIQNKAGRVNYTNKVDVWSLGVVLYAMFCGRLPFVDNEGETVAQLIQSGKFDFQHPVFRYVPESAKDLIKNMLTVNPNQRPSIHEVLMHPWLKFKDWQNVDELNSMFADKIGEPPLKKRRID